MDGTPTIEELNDLVEAELREMLEPRQLPLYRMMSYHLGWDEGPAGATNSQITSAARSHGVASLTACFAAGGDLRAALPAAVAVELVSSFCQVHEDVQGGLPQRNGRDAVWWVWGPAQAINAGDGMHALARLAVFRMQDAGVPPEATFKAMQLLDEACLSLCEGRFQDLEAQDTMNLSVEQYLEMASKKTGALLSCAMSLGALAASAEGSLQESLSACGASLGVALQIGRDLGEIWDEDQSGSGPSGEALNKKKLLPVVYALEVANPNQKRRLGDIYFRRVLESKDIESLRQLLEELGARDHCHKVASRYRSGAEAAIHGPGVSPEGAAALNRLVGSLLGA